MRPTTQDVSLPKHPAPSTPNRDSPKKVYAATSRGERHHVVSPCRDCVTGKDTGYVCRVSCNILKRFQEWLDHVDHPDTYSHIIRNSRASP